MIGSSHHHSKEKYTSKTRMVYGGAVGMNSHLLQRNLGLSHEWLFQFLSDATWKLSFALRINLPTFQKLMSNQSRSSKSWNETFRQTMLLRSTTKINQVEFSTSLKLYNWLVRIRSLELCEVVVVNSLSQPFTYSSLCFLFDHNFQQLFLCTFWSSQSFKLEETRRRNLTKRATIQKFSLRTRVAGG